MSKLKLTARSEEGSDRYVRVDVFVNAVRAGRLTLERRHEACKAALAHVAELREAWELGALHDRDGRGAERSNRNVEVEAALRNILAKAEPPA